MKWFTKKEFDGRYEVKLIRNFRKILRRKHLESCELLKTNTLVGFSALAVIIYVIGVIFFDVVITKVGIRKVLTSYSIAKNSLLYQEIFDKIASMLAVYDVEVQNQPLKFVRLGRDNDGGYVVPVEAVEASDALIGYGIADDISFEREFSQRFDKPSFGFDCGVQNIETGDSRCHFFSECIGNSDHLMWDQVSSGQIHSFYDQLRRFGLIDKKIFIKMDIEGAEFDVMDDILKYAQQIMGIVLEVHTPSDDPIKTLKLLSSLKRYFVLVHLHGTNLSINHFKTKYAKNVVPTVLELTYINKKLLSSYKISKNQKHPHPIDQRDCINIPECEFEIIPMD